MGSRISCIIKSTFIFLVSHTFRHDHKLTEVAGEFVLCVVVLSACRVCLLGVEMRYWQRWAAGCTASARLVVCWVDSRKWAHSHERFESVLPWGGELMAGRLCWT